MLHQCETLVLTKPDATSPRLKMISWVQLDDYMFCQGLNRGEEGFVLTPKSLHFLVFHWEPPLATPSLPIFCSPNPCGTQSHPSKHTDMLPEPCYLPGVTHSGSKAYEMKFL